jgi:hypothetical protein
MDIDKISVDFAGWTILVTSEVKNFKLVCSYI